MKRSRSEAVRAALSSYLERRNYGPPGRGCSTPEQMAVEAIVDCDSGRANSILFSSVNNDPQQADRQFAKLRCYVETLEPSSLRDELSELLCPLLCHLHLEMLRGGHADHAAAFLKRHARGLFRPLGNAAEDDPAPPSYAGLVLDDLDAVSSLRDVDGTPRLAAFRSCKYELRLTSEAMARLKTYLGTHGHVLLVQVLQTWFHFDVVGRPPRPPDDAESPAPPSRRPLRDDAGLCNGHADPGRDGSELGELREAIRASRRRPPPLKLFAVSSDSNLVCAALDPRRRTLFCGFGDSGIGVWDVGGGAPDARRPRGNVSRVRLAADGARPAPEDDPGPSRRVRLLGHGGPVQALRPVETADGRGILLSASRDGGVRAWRTEDGSCAAAYGGHDHPVWCLDAAGHGAYAASGSRDGTAKLWTLDRTFPLRTFAGHGSDVNAVRFHPNGNYLATGSADKTVRLWCVSAGRQVRLFPGHRGSVHCLAFSPDGRTLASAGEDRRIKIWDIAAGVCSRDLKAHRGAVTVLDWSPRADDRPDDLSDDSGGDGDGGVLLSAGADGTVRLWDSDSAVRGSPPGPDRSPTVYDCRCPHVVAARDCRDWLAAVAGESASPRSH